MNLVAHAPEATRLVAIGDLHANAIALRRCLILGGVCRETEDGLAWSAPPGTCVVFTGDYLDGPAGPAGEHRVLRGLLRIEAEARRHQGSVIALLGNHESDLLGGAWCLCAGRAQQSVAFGLPERERLPRWTCDMRREPVVATADSPPPVVASWLACRPLVAVVGDCVLVHGGPTPAWEDQLRSHTNPEAALEGALEARGLAHPLFATSVDSLLAAADPDRRDPPLFAGDEALRCRFLDAFGARGPLLVGHNPWVTAANGLVPLDSGLKPGSDRIRVAVVDLTSGRCEVRQTSLQEAA
jgi:diadenosine tetraphosphatase ApaH/serine/threonine PP2A family protein phosphatase